MEGVWLWVELNGGGVALRGAEWRGVVFWVELNGEGVALGGAEWSGWCPG